MVDLSFYNGKKVLVTGHTGFKGTWLCRILTLAGADVTGYALSAVDGSMFNLIDMDKSVNSVIGDIRDLNSIVELVKNVRPEIVFHLAAQPIVRESYVNPVDTYTTNVIGTVNILEAVRLVDSIKSFVNVTTDKVYENKEWAWGYRENERLCGFDPYSNSKSCSELVTYSYRNSFFDKEDSTAISTARSGNVIGGGDFSVDRIVPDCVRASINKQPIIVRNPHSTRPYQHVLECLRGYLTLAIKQYDKSYADNYNFGPDDSDCVTTGTIVDLFCKYWNGASWINKSDDGPHEANFLKLDCSKAKSVLKWYPIWGIDTALQKTVEWYQAYADKRDLTDVTDKQIKEYFKI